MLEETKKQEYLLNNIREATPSTPECQRWLRGRDQSNVARKRHPD
jgi:hypothetical protein